ncbi:MAG: nitroreductase family protein [Caldiserica bacterium]|jgi:nitroreductase|nr:nitroreductase family protein [Caldisericota bacterium]
MDLQEAIKNRRSIRRFKKEKIPEEDLRSLVLESGIWAPSGGNAQTWRFLIITDEKILKKIKLVSPGLLGDPPSLIVICHDMSLAQRKGGRLGEAVLSLMDTAMAAQNIMLQAYSMGFGTCPIASFHPEAIKQILNLPAYFSPQLIISVGIPDENPAPPLRNREVVWVNKYGD